MTGSPAFLAIDLGAESGRVSLGTLHHERLELSEMHRFPNRPVRLPDGLYWDAMQLWSEIKTGLAQTTHGGHNLVAIGLDAWGVDFALLDQHGSLIGNPHHYRDDRTQGILDEAFSRVPRERLFGMTGNQFMAINTLYQLLAMVLTRSPQLEIAHTLLMMPDLFNYWLTGQAASEFSIATTTQCHDPSTGDWAWPLIKALGIPIHIFPKIRMPGTQLGLLSSGLAREFGIAPLAVIAPACHDTASAVAAIPAETADFAWISSGTWSILGTNMQHAILSPEALRYDFTNEGGVSGTWRLSRNITGLWIEQECRRAWTRQGEESSHEELTRLAAAAEPFTAFVDVDADEFSKPGEMPEKIRAYCSQTHQRIPETQGAIVRCVLESLALKYRSVLERLEEVSGRRLDTVHIVGGGSRNRLLDQFTSNATHRLVVAGPVEATAIGNILVQAVALGWLGSLSESRSIVRRSFAADIYEPQEQAAWDQAYGRFLKVTDGALVGENRSV
jgi:rhamnulokinase